MGKRMGSHREKLLSNVAIHRLAAGRHLDGGGLYLEVDASGARRWLLRTMVQGRRRDIGLGSAPRTKGDLGRVSLAEARETAAQYRKLARAGGDPIAERRKALVPTFERAAEECYAVRVGNWRNEKHKAQWLSTLKTYAFPKIGKLLVNRIGPAEVLSVLTPIWLSKPETARRVRQRVGIVLEWALAMQYRDTGSPTREVSKALPMHKDSPKHHAAMPHSDVPGFLGRLKNATATEAVKAALEFAVLTAARTTETLHARWNEVNWTSSTWTLPKERTKNKARPHTVPLSARALEILGAMKASHSGEGDFIFESRSGEPLSQMALLMLMRRMKTGATVHGFRSSFRDWAGEKTNFPREIVEAALAHAAEGGETEAAYRRTEFLEKRRKLMNAWSAYCGGGAEVVKFRRVSDPQSRLGGA